jgi:hypothetical protein
MKKVISLLAMAISVVSCNREKDPIKYAEHEGNGLRKTVSVGDVVYTVQYKPTAYIIEMEHLDKKTTEQRIKQLQGTAWFNISFSIKGYNQSPLRYQVSGLEEYNVRQDYYLNKAPKDMYLLYGKDTLYVSSYWFENNQNLSTHETMVVGFRLPEKVVRPEEDLRFSFYDRVYQNGIIKTTIKKDDLENIPGI